MSESFGFEPSKKAGYYFVSYHREDIHKIGGIVRALNELGVELWYDYGIHYGDEWNEQIANRIQQCEAVLLFVTTGIFQNENSYVYKEYEMAKTFFQKKVFTIYVDQIDRQMIPNRWLAWWIEMKQNQGIYAWKYQSYKEAANRIFGAIGRSANNDNSSYLILEENQEKLLEHFPVAYWIVRLLIIALRDKLGNLFLPLSYRYEGLWTTPRIAHYFYLPTGKRIRDTSKIIDYYREWMEQHYDLLNLLEVQQHYQMGMTSNDTRKYDAYTEYKISPAYRDRYNCYHVEEYDIVGLDPDQLINIYDPEHLQNYRYFPLDAYGNANMSSKYVEFAGRDVLFFGKKLSTNVVRLLGRSNRFADCTYDLPYNVRLSETGSYYDEPQ